MRQSVAILKGVGPAREEVLAAAGIRTLKDLLLLLPRRYNLRLVPGRIADLRAGATGAATGTVRSSKVSGWSRRKNLRVVVAGPGDEDDNSPQIELVLFGRAFMKKVFRPGREVTFQGKVTEDRGKLQMLAPDFRLDGDAGPGFPGLLPVYALPEGIYPRTFQSWLAAVIEELPRASDWRETAGPARSPGLPPRGLMPLAESLRKAHWPADTEEAEGARRRLAYEEFFALQFALAGQRMKRRSGRGVPAALPVKLDRVYARCLPFELTEAQKRSVAEIGADLASGRPMHRLLQGDVGSGKTAVALYLLLAAALDGGQAALMAPTEVLADQHARTLNKLLAPAGIRPFFLRAGMKKADLEEKLYDPETRVVVGTHALIQSRVGFRDLRVCVVDEQHKFGVRQRWNLKVKGRDPHVLIMTATPIPRTLTLTLYGELDVSILDSLPPGRRTVETRALSSFEDAGLQEHLARDLETGGRVFIVCPLVEESEHLDLEAAVQVHARLSGLFGARFGVGLLHGRMDSDAKQAEVEAFRSGERPLLVTTAVVEVGVDVPEASTVVIMDAWRFGLSQLHQIRGRVGRGDRPSRCYLVGEPTTETGQKRIGVIVGETDGFRIAEEDLRMRGPGEPAGLRQHGLPPLRAGDYIADVDLMVAAREDARICAEGQGAGSQRGASCAPLLDAGDGPGAWIG